MKRGIRVSLVLILFLIVASANSIAIKDIISLKGNIVKNDGTPVSGNITVRIYDQESGGSLIYDSGNDFLGSIDKSKYNIMLGSKSQELDLEYGKTYYLDIEVNNEDIDFKNEERMMFQSSVGTVKNISLEGDKLTIIGGNVGLGNINPTNAFDVSGTTKCDDFECTQCVDSGEIISSEIQQRVSGCSSGYFIRAINEDGSVNCEHDSYASCSCSNCDSYYLVDGYSDVWNDDGSSDTLIFEGDINQYLINIDGYDNSVGIGTSSPQAKLDTYGTIRSTAQTIPSSGSGLEMNYDGTKSNLASISRPSTWQDLSIVAADLSISTGTTPSNALSRIYMESAGQVGIGKTSPNYKLDVNGNIRASDEIMSTYLNAFRSAVGSYGLIQSLNNNYYNMLSTNSGSPYGSSNSYRPFMIDLNNAKTTLAGGSVVVEYGGKVGINRDPTTYQFEVQGDAAKTTGSSWISLSDKRLKNITENITKGIEIISKLTPIKYEWNELYKEKYGDNNDTMYGFTAQNVKEVLPEMVKEDKEGYLWYSPSGYEAVLTKAIQEIKAENEEIKKDFCNEDNTYSFC